MSVLKIYSTFLTSSALVDELYFCVYLNDVEKNRSKGDGTGLFQAVKYIFAFDCHKSLGDDYSHARGSGQNN